MLLSHLIATAKCPSHYGASLISSPDQDGYLNSLIGVGSHTTDYAKRQLVPFGEFVPMQRFFARVFDFMNVPMSNMVPGLHHQAPMTLGKVKILPSICYEITYPELSLTMDPSIGLLLTVTNDAWFGESTAQAQHLQMAAMRSIELNRPGLFVSNDGITAIISARGVIESSAPVRSAAVLQGSVQAKTGFTPWMRNGFDPILAVSLIMLFASIRFARQQTKKTHSAEAAITSK